MTGESPYVVETVLLMLSEVLGRRSRGHRTAVVFASTTRSTTTSDRMTMVIEYTVSNPTQAVLSPKVRNIDRQGVLASSARRRAMPQPRHARATPQRRVPGTQAQL
jgi:hypothetical protein